MPWMRALMMVMLGWRLKLVAQDNLNSQPTKLKFL